MGLADGVFSPGVSLPGYQYTPAPVGGLSGAQRPVLQPEQEIAPDALEGGVHAGVAGLKGSLASLYGNAAEVLGAPDAANRAYDYARGQQQEEQTSGAGIPQWKDVHNLKDAVNFGVGNAARALPYVAPAVVAPAVARVAGANQEGRYLAGVAANAAPFAGGEALQLHDDPAMANMTPTERLLTSAGVGSGQAALMEAPGHLINERAFGTPGFAAKASVNPLKGIAEDTALHSAGMGAGSGAATMLGQSVNSALDPNRDTTHDTDNLIESVAGGVGAGLPFAAPGAVMAHTVGAARAPVIAAVDSAKTAANTMADAAGNAKVSAQQKLSGWLDSRKEQSAQDEALLSKKQSVTPDGTDGTAQLAEDDATRNQAAERLAQQYVVDATAPEQLKQAATSFLQSAKNGEAWTDLSSAIKSHATKEKFNNAVESVKQWGSSLADGVKSGFSRENAQAPIADPFDDLLTNTLYSHANVDASGDRTTSLIKLAQVTPALKKWVANGFSATEGGKVMTPPGLDKLFKDPVEAITTTHDLMQRQGLLKDDSAGRLKEITTALNEHTTASSDLGAVVEDNLLPTAQAEHQFSGADHQHIASEIKRMIVSGKIDESALDKLFGPNKQKVLDAVEKDTKLNTGEYQRDERTTGEHNPDDAEAATSSDEIGGMTDAMHPNEVKADVGWHGPYDMKNEGAVRGHKAKMDELRTLGKGTKEVGAIDRLREEHGSDPEAFVHHTVKEIERNGHLVPDEHAAHPDKYLNDRFRYVRSEDASDKREPIDIHGREFDNLTGKGESNQWGLAAGKGNEYGGPERGRLWFERAPGKTKDSVDRTTGEITPGHATKPVEFNTSANKIIGRMRQGMKDVGGERSHGIVDQHDMLLQGISSMLNAKNEDGSPALTGRVGIKRGIKPVEWLGKDGKLPDDFKLFGGTVKDVAAERTRMSDEKLTEQMTKWADSAKDMFKAEQVREALKTKDMGKLAEMRDAFIKDNWEDSGAKKVASVKETKIVGKSVDKETGIQSHRTKTETRHLTETEEMAEAANKKEDATPRKFDEATGEEIQPKATRDELSAAKEKLEAEKPAQKQIDWTLDALRKGIPAFSEGIRKLSDEQRAGIKDVLTKMGAAKTADNPIWRGKPPKDMEAFGNRARAALARLDSVVKESTQEAHRRADEAANAAADRYDGAHNKVPSIELQDESQFLDPKKANDQTAKAKEATPDEQKAVVDKIHALLGKDMNATFAKDLIGKSGAKISGDWQKGAIRIALNAHDPMSVGFHESMHELMQRMMESKNDKSLEALQHMADSASVKRQMELAFAGEKAVLEALKNDPSERVAYAFQLWAAGKLRVGPETQTIFHKIGNMIRKVLGLMTKDQKAVQLMEQFASGKLADRSAMARILNTEEARGAYVAKVSKLISPIMSKGGEYVGFAENALTGSDNPHLDWVGRQMNNKTGVQGDAQGFLSAKEQMHAQFDNKFAKTMHGRSKDEINAALEGLQKKEWHADPVVEKIQRDIAGVFKEMYSYGAEVGLQRMDPATGKWVAMGKMDDYRMPVSWDASKLVNDGDKFKALMLEHHSGDLENIAKLANEEVAAGEHAGEFTASWEKLNNKDTKTITKEDVLNAIHNRMIRTNGQVEVRESQNELGFSPNMKAINKRTLHFIDQKIFHEFQEKDMAKILTTYTSQMTGRTEYARRFGADGKILQGKMDAAMNFESDRAMKDDPKLSKDDADIVALKKLAPAQRAIMAMEGTLGHDISATLRKVNAYSIVYQNLRLLGYPLFSSIIDPLGIMVNGGEMKDAYATLKRGFGDVAKEWGKLTGLRAETEATRAKDNDEATRVAEMIGTIDSGMFMSTLGNAYGSQFLGKTARGFNDKFFKWNGMEPFTRAMRIGATQAGISFIKRHYETPNAHSERYFKELGLDRKDVQITKDGGLNVDNRNVQQAVMRWVDGSILRPNAAMRPTMASDPHYATFYHLKQFMYATHAVISKRIVTELKHGNMDPTILAFAGYIPTMLAADAAKGMLQTSMGGTAPIWEHEGVSGVVGHGLMRSGLTGPAQMALDIPQYGPTSILGPTAEQITSAATHPVGETIRSALAVGPFNFNLAGNAAND